MTLKDLYYKMMRDFGNQRELVSASYSCNFGSYADCEIQSKSLFEDVKNDVLITRKTNELHFHNMLLHQMFSRLQEIKYYSEVDIFDTRRLVSVSADCITAIQILVRDVIHLNVYFRSSDFDGALPADLEFICSLPKELICHLDNMTGIPGYEEATIDNINKISIKPIKLNLMFGSLHRTT
jgi:hypothetical protein